jgi:hypothetical protein
VEAPHQHRRRPSEPRVRWGGVTGVLYAADGAGSRRSSHL